MADLLTPGDRELIDRLIAVDEKAAPVVAGLGRDVPRFADYRAGLRKAVEQVEGGDRNRFSGARCDSYHTVWWHLHEDLLLALGMERNDHAQQEGKPRRS